MGAEKNSPNTGTRFKNLCIDPPLALFFTISVQSFYFILFHMFTIDMLEIFSMTDVTCNFKLIISYFLYRLRPKMRPWRQTWGQTSRRWRRFIFSLLRHGPQQQLIQIIRQPTCRQEVRQRPISKKFENAGTKKFDI